MMRSITFFSTSRPDFALISSLLNLSNITDILRINLVIFQDVGDHSSIQNVNKIIINSSIQVDLVNKKKLEIEISDSLITLKNEDPNTIIFIIGDRWEALYVAYKCLLLKIPVIHHSGGDITNGAIDNQIRDAITALSDFHLTSHPLHTQRVIKLGEHPSKVLTVGEPTLNRLLENFIKSKKNQLDYKKKDKFVLCTFHSSTLDKLTYQEQAINIVNMLNLIPYKIVITYPNMDEGSEIIHEALEKFSRNHADKVSYFPNLGEKYHELMMNCYFVFGNSSSGILEAGMAGKLSINVGDRQNGRLSSKSVINIRYSTEQLRKVISNIETTLKSLHKNDYISPYFQEDCVDLIKNFISQICQNDVVEKIKFKDFD